MARIELIAIAKNKVYSVGAIIVSSKGDVYFIRKQKDDGGAHTSRHKDGKTYLSWNFKKKLLTKIRTGLPINDFKGIEHLETFGFTLSGLPLLYDEYKMKKNNGIFAFDMREYKEELETLNIAILILTKEGLLSLYKSWENIKRRQIYIYIDCHPMIAIQIAGVSLILPQKNGHTVKLPAVQNLPDFCTLMTNVF